MDDYIDAVCATDELGALPPLDDPSFDKDAETWDLYFEYYDPYVGANDLVCLPFESKEEAWSTIRHIKELRENAQRKLDEKKAKLKSN